MSEFAQQLREKQKIQFSYGLRDRQMRLVFNRAAKNKGATGKMIMTILEKRLDNAVYRLGLAMSRSVARQLVGHGHILVNGRRVTVPSALVRTGDVIAVRPQSKDYQIFKNLADYWKSYQAPVWLSFDKEKVEGKVVSEPKDLEMPFDVNLVVDYYSK